MRKTGKGRPRRLDPVAYARTARAYERRQQEQRSARAAAEARRTAPSEVRVHRVDGSVVVLRAYTPAELRAVAPERLPIPRRLREAVYARDGRACRYCGAVDDLSLDHVVPVALGGSTTYRNLVTCCRPCNSRKGASVWEVPPLVVA